MSSTLVWATLVSALSAAVVLVSAADSASPAAPRHSYLVLGARTAIIGEDGQVTWEYRGGSRDGFVLPNGHRLITWADRVEEVTPDRQVVFTYRLSPENGELSTAQRLYNGNTLVTELGRKPRLLEVDGTGRVVQDVPLQPETDNVHMQTRMARQLKVTPDHRIIWTSDHPAAAGVHHFQILTTNERPEPGMPQK